MKKFEARTLTMKDGGRVGILAVKSNFPRGEKFLDNIAKKVYNVLTKKELEFNIYYWPGNENTTENYVFFLKEGEENKITKDQLPFESQWVTTDEEPLAWEKYKIDDFEAFINAKKFGI
jgi:hypothetical protein